MGVERADEWMATHGTVNFLIDSDMFQFFKKTLASSLQVEIWKTIAFPVSAFMRRSRRGSFHLRLIGTALSCKRADFTQVISMIDEMVALLQLKQRHDESESVSCESGVDIAQDKSKPLAMNSESHQSARSDFDDPLSAVSQRLTAVVKS